MDPFEIFIADVLAAVAAGEIAIEHPFDRRELAGRIAAEAQPGGWW